ncbi:MAG: hypothetical protein ABSA47_14565 [Verrucomicrobiota bacterium]|jgi:hypothetical protein
MFLLISCLISEPTLPQQSGGKLSRTLQIGNVPPFAAPRRDRPVLVETPVSALQLRRFAWISKVEFMVSMPVLMVEVWRADAHLETLEDHTFEKVPSHGGKQLDFSVLL